MTRRWMLVGLMGLGPLLAEAHWQDNASLSPSEPTSARAQAIPQEGSSPSAVQPPERVAQ